MYFSFLSYGIAKFPITAGIDKAKFEAQSTKEIYYEKRYLARDVFGTQQVDVHSVVRVVTMSNT